MSTEHLLNDKRSLVHDCVAAPKVNKRAINKK